MSSGDRAALGRRAARGSPLGCRGIVEATRRPSRSAGPSRARGPEPWLHAASGFRVFL